MSLPKYYSSCSVGSAVKAPNKVQIRIRQNNTDLDQPHCKKVIICFCAGVTLPALLVRRPLGAHGAAPRSARPAPCCHQPAVVDCVACQQLAAAETAASATRAARSSKAAPWEWGSGRGGPWLEAGKPRLGRALRCCPCAAWPLGQTAAHFRGTCAAVAASKPPAWRGCGWVRLRSIGPH